MDAAPRNAPATRLGAPRALAAAAALLALAAAPFALRARGAGERPEAIAPDAFPATPAPAGSPTPAEVRPPARLSETGLYAAGGTSEIAPGNLLYVPQYPLWSDGAAKRRWVRLPPGAVIDGSRPDAWELPVGTRFWKEFRFGERVETRYMERRADGTYLYATYVWDAALGDAVLAPDEGVRRVAEIAPGVFYDVPSQDDCLACHEGRPSPVLGFGALQLSPDRDPLAPHREPLPREAVELDDLVREGLLVGFPPELVERPPRIVAPSATARAAAGYLFGNCAGCHNAEGPLAELGLDFDHSVSERDGYGRLVASVAGRASRFRLPDEDASVLVTPGHPEQSAIAFRMGSRDPSRQMPPLGTRVVDEDAARLVARWISNDLDVARTKGSSR